MTKQEKEIKEEVILANLENDLLNELKVISQLTNDAWVELEALDGRFRSYTDFHGAVVKTIRKYGFC